MVDAVPIDFLEKRRVLYGKGSDSKCLAAATELVGKGRLAEALEYLERNRDEGLLERIRRDAVKVGDAFSLSRVGQILKTEIDPREWRDLAQWAESKERWFDCVNALRRAGDEEKAEEVRAEHCPDFVPFRPAGK